MIPAAAWPGPGQPEPRARHHRGCWRSRPPPARDALSQGDAARRARFVQSEATSQAPRARCPSLAARTLIITHDNLTSYPFYDWRIIVRKNLLRAAALSAISAAFLGIGSGAASADVATRQTPQTAQTAQTNPGHIDILGEKISISELLPAYISPAFRI